MGLRGRKSFIDETTFFITTTVVKHAKIFTKDEYCNILIDNIRHYQQQYGFIILGYAIMPSHFHWIVETDPSKGTASDIMRDIKKYSAWDIMEALAQDGRLELCRLFTAMSIDTSDQKRKFWTKRFDDEGIRNPGMMRTKLNYIHNNPVKAGLVANPEDYKYSSARNYILGDHSILYVDTTRFVA